MAVSASVSAPALALAFALAGAVDGVAAPLPAQQSDVAQRPELALDRKGKKQLVEFAERFWQARPMTRFEEWDAAKRTALFAEAKKLGTIPEGSLGEVVDLLWQPVSEFGPGVPKSVAKKRAKKRGKKGKRPKWLPKPGKRPKKSRRQKNRRVKATIPTPYGEAWFYLNNVGPDRGLILGLHGGGEGAGSADEPRHTWVDKNCIGMYPQGIRLVHDTWNTVHGERFLLTLIEIAKAHFGVDPNRVYSMGFSMGGSGSWFMAGRHADLLAGAAPCAGVLMAEPKSQLARKEDVKAIQHGLVPNVRNLAMYYYTGLVDTNCMPGTYLFVADRLDELRKADPGGYGQIRFSTHENLAHAHPRGEPKKLLQWLTGQKRDPFPKTVVWETATNPFPQPSGEPVTRPQKTKFYWLGCEELVDAQKIRATLDENVIEIAVTRRELSGITIYVNPEMIDVNRDVVVRHDGKEVYRGKPVPNLATVLESLDARVDRVLVFDRRIDL